MQRFASRLPGQAHFLTAKDCLEAFEFFDQDGTGLMEFPEMQEAFNRMLDPARVDISAYEGQSFTPATFRTTAEWCHRTFPQYNVAGNLMKFIKENREKTDDDDADITDKELRKLFDTYDRDHSDQMSIQELIGVWGYLRLPFHLIMDARAMDGSVSFEEFCGLIRDINAAHPDLDVDEKINTFVAGLGAGPPDINTAPDQANDSAGAVADEDPPKKKAFLVGINYVGTSCELGGCINDANNQKAALMENFGFGEEDIRMMTDDTDDKPTAENIRAGLEWLIEGADAGDYLFFAYSGHGSQLPCQDATEPDGKNEILCPLDLQDDWYANSIKDDYLYDLFYKRVPDGVRCLCVYDCCHSGTMADLSCTRTFNPPWEESDVKDRYLEPPEEMAAEVEAFAAAAQESGITQRDTAFPGDGSKDLIWTISGCQDNQTSADATIDGQRQGACTWALLSSLKTGGQGPWKYQYESLLGEMRKKLRTGGYTQVPGMATTEDELFQRFYLANRP
mmetsp:Transcript_21877/g.60907  ORF Transcript_21877/g.60907 Transcript_21877/m.60907 type:complete len:507 (+) Transcript_21877:88-1608(+)